MTTTPTVLVFQNGIVLVFGQDGQQMPSLQGPLATVRATLATIVPEAQWQYVLYPTFRGYTVTGGQPDPAWLAGRAAAIARSYADAGLALGLTLALTIAELEANRGRLLAPPWPTWRDPQPATLEEHR